MTWSKHPFLPHWCGIINGRVVVRCARSMDPDAGFVVWSSSTGRVLTNGATAKEAMDRFDALRGAA